MAKSNKVVLLESGKEINVVEFEEQSFKLKARTIIESRIKNINKLISDHEKKPGGSVTKIIKKDFLNFLKKKSDDFKKNVAIWFVELEGDLIYNVNEEGAMVIDNDFEPLLPLNIEIYEKIEDISGVLFSLDGYDGLGDDNDYILYIEDLEHICFEYVMNNLLPEYVAYKMSSDSEFWSTNLSSYSPIYNLTTIKGVTKCLEIEHDPMHFIQHLGMTLLEKEAMKFDCKELIEMVKFDEE